MTHPLTDETIDEIQMRFGGPCLECYDDMRGAYDKGFDDAIECIREAGLAHYSALYEAQENFYNNRRTTNGTLTD